MKSIRVALLTAGALVALVGGAETANWGLAPLTASLNTTGPQIMTSSVTALSGSAAQTGLAASQSSDKSAALDTTSVAFKPALSLPVDTGPAEPRSSNEFQSDAQATAKSSLIAAPGPDGSDVQPSQDAPTATGGSPVRDTASGEATALGDGAVEAPWAGKGPD